MQDFYILQRTPQPLTAEQAQRWYFTVDMLGPEGIMAGDDTNASLMLGAQTDEFIYLIPLVRHLTAQEAETIVEGYLRVTEHDFEIETSNVYRSQTDFGHPWEYEINIEQEAKETITDAYLKQAHNEWINEMMHKGYRYGLNLSINEKTHPAMRPWDDLPDNFKKSQNFSDKQLMDFYSNNVSKFNL